MSPSRKGRDRIGFRGGADLYLGAKLEALSVAASGISLGIVPGLTLPTGSAVFSSGGVDPSVTVALARGLPAGLDVAAALSIASKTERDERQRETSAGVGVTRGLMDRFSLFGEIYGESADEGTVLTVNGGLATLVHRDVQLDLQLGRNVRSGSAWTLAAGIVLRRCPGAR